MASFTLGKYVPVGAEPVPRKQTPTRPTYTPARVLAVCRRLEEELRSKFPDPTHDHKVHRARERRVIRWLQGHTSVVPLWGPVRYAAKLPIYGYRIVMRTSNINTPPGIWSFERVLRDEWQIITAQESVTDGVILYREGHEIGRLL